MKILVDLPDELYDTLRSKTLYLTSGARSNGKHLVCELIGCVLNGTVVEDENKAYKKPQAPIYDKTVPTGYETWNYDNETCKYCGTNPNNGGSGVCHCALAVHKIT